LKRRRDFPKGMVCILKISYGRDARADVNQDTKSIGTVHVRTLRLHLAIMRGNVM
jgi:hypothetical protein